MIQHALIIGKSSPQHLRFLSQQYGKGSVIILNIFNTKTELWQLNIPIYRYSLVLFTLTYISLQLSAIYFWNQAPNWEIGGHICRQIGIDETNEPSCTVRFNNNHMSPVHQRSWYWLFRVDNMCCCSRLNCIDLGLANSKIWFKMWIYLL